MKKNSFWLNRVKTSSCFFFLPLLFQLGCKNFGQFWETGEAAEKNFGGDPFVPATKAYAFVSSLLTPGDMSGLTTGGCSGTGMIKADCACTAMARSANLLRRPDSIFVAWLSGEAPQIDALCRLRSLADVTPTGCANTGGETWYNTNEQIVGNGLGATPGQLTSGTLVNRIDFDEKKNHIISPSPLDYVWAGTSSSGVSNGSACSDWTSANPVMQGRIGAISLNWTSSGVSDCDQNLRVYCFALP
jgi:hypothetical protein